MSFELGLLLYVLGSAVVALCLLAIPGPHRADEPGHDAHGHGGGH